MTHQIYFRVIIAMSLDSLLLNALRWHLVFAGTLQLAEGRRGEAGRRWGRCRRECTRTGHAPPLCLIYFGEDTVLRIVFTDTVRARAWTPSMGSRALTWPATIPELCSGCWGGSSFIPGFSSRCKSRLAFQFLVFVPEISPVEIF